MNQILSGPLTLLGDNIDTDQIYPGRYLALTAPEEIAAHCLEGVDPLLPARLKPGCIVAAGRNFGCGSSREHAAIALLHRGVRIVLAESFARIFYRNAINLGLPLLVCKGLSPLLQDGGELTVDLPRALVILSGGRILQGELPGEQAMRILEAGGIKPLMRRRMGLSEKP